MLTVINHMTLVCLLDFSWFRTVMIIYCRLQHYAILRAVEHAFIKSIIINFCDDSSTKYEIVLTKTA